MYNALKFLFISLGLILWLQNTTSFAEKVLLPEGSDVLVSLEDTISSASNNEGDRIRLRVDEDVYCNDGKTILIKKGTPVKGYISNLERKDRMGESGRISITVKSTKAIDGSYIPLSGSVSRAAKDKDMTASLFWIGIWATQQKGKDIIVPTGTMINASVDRDTEIETSQILPIQHQINP